MSSTGACPPDGSKTIKISYTEELTDPTGAGPSRSHLAAARCHADEGGNAADVTGGCPDGTH
jgi:hypothetical protein